MTFTGISRTIALVASIAGGVALAGAGIVAGLDTGGTFGGIASGAVGGSARVAEGDAPLTADASGVTGVSVDSRASDFTLRFDDVAEARLEIAGEHRYRWTLSRDGDELEVDSARRWGDLCFFGCFSGQERVTLTLPVSLEDRIDADVTVAAGRLSASGAFRDLELEIGAGSLQFDGAARSLGLEVEAGRADITAEGVRKADFDVSAGKAEATLTGDAPGEVELDVSAGRLDLVLPEAAYDVRSDVSAGNLDNRLETSQGSRHRVTAEVSAGSAILRSSRG